jgi:hypothetical protein
MEDAKKIEFSAENLLPEIPPLFKEKTQEKKQKKADCGLLFRQFIAAALILIALIIFKVFFPEIFVVLNSWLVEKFNMSPLSL